MSDLQTRQLIVGDQAAYLEGTGAGEDGSDRIPLCVADDLVGDRIAAMRGTSDQPLRGPAQATLPAPPPTRKTKTVRHLEPATFGLGVPV